jgi:hypothetical protein
MMKAHIWDNTTEEEDLAAHLKSQNETMIDEIFNIEITRQLLGTYCNVPLDDDATVDLIWSHCGGNPWNAVPMYELLKMRDRVV